MKRLKVIAVFICCFLFITSCAQRVTRKGNATRTQKTVEVQDSIEYYETDFVAKQKNYLEFMLGEWKIETMKRQARMNEEKLQNVNIIFKDDFTFSGSAGCNKMNGKYTLKGASVRFSNIITTKMACDLLDQEAALLRLLQQTVSAYSVEGDQLLLRDGSSNIIFTASRTNTKKPY